MDVEGAIPMPSGGSLHDGDADDEDEGEDKEPVPPPPRRSARLNRSATANQGVTSASDETKVGKV